MAALGGSPLFINRHHVTFRFAITSRMSGTKHREPLVSGMLFKSTVADVSGVTGCPTVLFVLKGD